MVEYADRIIQMMDGHLERIVMPGEDLACLADPAACVMIDTEVLGIAEG
jgi:hypothetical protein